MNFVAGVYDRANETTWFRTDATAFESTLPSTSKLTPNSYTCKDAKGVDLGSARQYYCIFQSTFDALDFCMSANSGCAGLFCYASRRYCTATNFPLSAALAKLNLAQGQITPLPTMNTITSLISTADQTSMLVLTFEIGATKSNSNTGPQNSAGQFDLGLIIGLVSLFIAVVCLVIVLCWTLRRRRDKIEEELRLQMLNQYPRSSMSSIYSKTTPTLRPGTTIIPASAYLTSPKTSYIGSYYSAESSEGRTLSFQESGRAGYANTTDVISHR